MLTLQISDEQLQESFEAVIKKVLLDANSYNNPLMDIVKKAVGTTYSKGTLTEEIEQKIITKVRQFMDTDEFDTMLGQAVAQAIAQREIDKNKK